MFFWNWFFLWCDISCIFSYFYFCIFQGQDSKIFFLFLRQYLSLSVIPSFFLHWTYLFAVLVNYYRYIYICVSLSKLPEKEMKLWDNPYPTAFPYGNGMVLHFYQQQESSTTKTVHKVINKGLKTYV